MHWHITSLVGISMLEKRNCHNIVHVDIYAIHNRSIAKDKDTEIMKDQTPWKQGKETK